MACIEAMATDLAAVRAALGRLDLVPVGLGVDPWHPPRRLLHEPRYDALEASLDRSGPAGRAMMCSTASVQVCLDAERGGAGAARLRAALAAGASAGCGAGGGVRQLAVPGGSRPTGWRSTRQSLWADLDPVRSLAPPGRSAPRDDWATHVLDAPVMCIRSDEAPWAVPVGLTFRDWIRTGAPRRRRAPISTTT